MIDEEANQAAYCLLALARSTPNRAKITVPDDRATLMDHFATSSPVTLAGVPSNPGAESLIRNAADSLNAVKKHPSQFMIARILTDLTRVPQELLNVKQQQTAATTTAAQLTHPGVLNSSPNKPRPTRVARVSSPAALQPAKSHRCPFPACERTYAKSSHLATHMRTHTGTPPEPVHTPHNVLSADYRHENS